MIKSKVKVCRLTIKLPWILVILNKDEDGGMWHVAVKMHRYAIEHQLRRQLSGLY